MHGRDDADGQRVLVAKRAADRGDGFADDDSGRITEWDGRQPMTTWIDLDQPDVVVDVPAHDRRRNAVAVAELDEEVGRRLDRAGADLAGVRDHMRVREDVALRRDDEARSLRPFHGVRRGIAEEGEDRDDPRRATCEDARGIEAVAGDRRGAAADRGGQLGLRA